jgi:hypothetical protein
MASRVFKDERGRDWTVWDVHPTLSERRVYNAGPAPGKRERRRYAEPRVQIEQMMSTGWLAFESRDGERRRLAPIPEREGGWSTAPLEQLRAWCAMANPAPPPRRLIE